MLKSFTIGNFKAFKSQQTVDIKPITLIFGPNSSGKSSIIHSLLFMNHFLETGEVDVHETRLGGESVDLGGFNQYANRSDGRSPSDVTFRFRLSSDPVESEKAPKISHNREIDIQFNHNDRTGNRQMSTYELVADGLQILKIGVPWEEKSWAFYDKWIFKVDSVNFEHPIIKTIINDVTRGGSSTSNEVQELMSSLVFSSDFLPGGTGGFGQCCEVDGRKSGDYSKLQSDTLNGLLQLISDQNSEICSAFRKMKYLGPLRSYLPRRWALSPRRHSEVDAEHEAWTALLGNRETRGAVNTWMKEHISSPYEIELRSLVSMDGILKHLVDGYFGTHLQEEDEEDGNYSAFEGWTRYCVERGDLESIPDLIFRETKTGVEVNHRDIGIGISQMLPILIQAYQGVAHWIAIEQPEVHLHPALQAELGDLFIETATQKHGANYIIETHSEHLILRILRRIRETTEGRLPDGLPPVTPEDVSVHFVQPGDNGATIKRLEIDQDGQFLDAWPGGFFEEGFRERFS